MLQLMQGVKLGAANMQLWNLHLMQGGKLCAMSRSKMRLICGDVDANVRVAANAWCKTVRNAA